MHQHYANAPIAEAVISLRVESSSEVDAAAFGSLADTLPQYAKRGPIRQLELGFSAVNTPSPQFHGKHQDLGVRLETADGRRVLQLQKREFTFSHLPPYSSWQEFRAEAQPLWPLFTRVTSATSVVRAAVRVINKLSLPGPISELPTYVKLLPRLPDAITSAPDTFFMQFQLPFGQILDGCRAIVTAASGANADARTTNLLLDFDVFVQGSFSIDDASVWHLLDRLSEGKNELFEACITSRTRELIR